MQLKPAPLKIDKPTRILVDRRKAVGDVLMITPVLRELRRRYSDAFIQVVTEETIVLENNPDIDAVISPSEMKATDPWDLYINLNDAYESNITSHYVEAYLYRAFGKDIDSIDRSLTLITTDDERDAVNEAVEQFVNKRYAVFHMRRFAWENKNVDPKTWTMLLAWLEAAYPDLTLVTVGAQYDMRMPGTQGPRYVDLVEQLSLGEIRHLIAGAEFFIGGDSGPYHIAATTDTPIVALLSHLAPEQILPWRDGEFGKNVHVVKSKVPCTGCYSRQVAPVRFLTCEQTEKDDQWMCNRMFDFAEITQELSSILDKGKE